MRKGLAFILLFVGIISFTNYGITQSWTSNDSLWAAQDILVGESRTLAGDTGILISIKPYAPWKLIELHVAIVLDDPCLIPQTGNNCEGNPKIGKFPYKLITPPTFSTRSIFVPYLRWITLLSSQSICRV